MKKKVNRLQKIKDVCSSSFVLLMIGLATVVVAAVQLHIASEQREQDLPIASRNREQDLQISHKRQWDEIFSTYIREVSEILVSKDYSSAETNARQFEQRLSMHFDNWTASVMVISFNTSTISARCQRRKIRSISRTLCRTRSI